MRAFRFAVLAVLGMFLAVGASFEYVLGVRKRAPQWMQRSGLEWFFRFVHEPKRLFFRYFVRDPAFLLVAAREWRQREPRRRRRWLGPVRDLDPGHTGQEPEPAGDQRECPPELKPAALPEREYRPSEAS